MLQNAELTFCMGFFGVVGFQKMLKVSKCTVEVFTLSSFPIWLLIIRNNN